MSDSQLQTDQLASSFESTPLDLPPLSEVPMPSMMDGFEEPTCYDLESQASVAGTVKSCIR